MARVAVENSLQSVKDALQQSGHDVVSMESGGLEGCDCCVISGQDKNVMGMAETTTQASVINAQGMTAEEVLQQVNQRLQ